MKKTLLILSIFCAGLTFSFAQDPGVKFYRGETLITAPIIEVVYDPIVDVVSASFMVKNETDSALNVQCARFVLANAGEDATNSFCWGNCYSPFVDTSEVVYLNSQASSEFISDFYPGGVDGMTLIKYVFFYPSPDGENVELNSIQVKFVTTRVGVKDNPQVIARAPYPSPASSFIKASLNLPAQGNVKVTLRNMLGTVVSTQQVDRQGDISTDVSMLPNGIYVYTVLVSDRPVYSKKVIVNH